MTVDRSSAIGGFYRRTIEERQAIAKSWAGLSDDHVHCLNDSGLSLSQADLMIENVIGRYSLPLALATNFRVNQRDYLIPMVIEEPSVVAACSYAAKQFRRAGGFTAGSDEPVMIGQIQLLDLENLSVASNKINEFKAEILADVDRSVGSLVARGGGAVDLELRPFPDSPIGDMLVVHILIDTRDAMGANAVNTALERVAPLIADITGGRVNLRILSNLSDQRKAFATGTVRADDLVSDSATGRQVVDAIVEAAMLAELDPYRAATHNKGIMNGIDAVMLATGNDWRAVEAGAHAYAARDGRYTSLTRWWKDEAGNLQGRIELPLAAGIVGGATRVHRGAQTALAILGVEVSAGIGGGCRSRRLGAELRRDTSACDRRYPARAHADARKAIGIGGRR